MERSVDVRTGESVAFSYELAGLGSRFFAVFIDLVIQVGVVIVAFVIIALLAGSGPHGRQVVAAGAAAKLGRAVALAFLAVAAFLLFDGYFILFEWLWGGRTPGKRLLGIRVVRDGGFPLDFVGSVVRNGIRILEFALGFYAVSALATLLSSHNRRLGDMAAGTIVVRDAPFGRLAEPPSRESDGESSDPLVADLGERERELVRRYALRRPSLGTRARSAVAADIAALVRPALAAQFTHLDDDDLLTYLANTSLRA
ncbi:MAG: RDD family protein [Candidatus Eremiobacteraeota bacterium]|nr:RDD family protein [Candidatus Eremiobacteraeota bacterium]